MAVKSRGRGTAAAFGMFLLLAGLVGGGVLYVVAQQRPGQAVDGFARAPIGCTTTLEFTEIGTFYVFEEAGAANAEESDCDPLADPNAEFGVEFTGDPVPDSIVDDGSVSYDVDGLDGRSVQRLEIGEIGQYTLEARGADTTVVAALGRDPDDGVDDLRRLSLIVAIGGLGIGLLLLMLAGWRSKKAATVGPPAGPGWGPASRSGDAPWPPESPTVDQVPVNPHTPDAPARVEPPPAPLPERTPAAPASWAAPGGEAAPLPPPDPADSPPPPVPQVEPVLPDTPGRTSGT